MKPWFIGYEAPLNRGMNAALGERVELDGDTLVRHAFVCGSTGAGKTVLSKAMVEEALLSGVPVIAIDLKGDLASMALDRRVQSPKSLAKVLGTKASGALDRFQTGFAAQPAVETPWRAFSERVDVRLFTPRSSLARRLAMSAFPSTGGKPRDQVEAEDRRALTHALVSGLATRMWGSSALKRRSAEIGLLEEVVGWAQEQGRSLEGLEGLKELGRLVAAPPIHQVGGMAIDDYLDDNARTRLRRELAAQCAGANQDWFVGEPLRVETLIGGRDRGQTPLAVVYLGHIVEFEDKSLVIAKVCAEVYRWMRAKGGADKLELLLYIDEVGGASGPTSYFPSNPYQPASKGPLGLLIRQGRAHGVGVLLATQNPMSVDVQALNNIGTWSVGRLNQDNEIKRLSAALSSLGGNEARLKSQLSSVPTHTFLTVGQGLKRPTLVDERWLSTIHTVLTPDQVRRVHELQLAGGGDGKRDEGSESPGSDLREQHPPLPPRPSGLDPETVVTRYEGEGLGGAWWLLSGSTEVELHDGARVVVGRSRKCDITFPEDAYMSGRHAELLPDGQQLAVRSLKANNPVRVNGAAVGGSEVVLAHGEPSSLQIGKTDVELEWRSN